VAGAVPAFTTAAQSIHEMFDEYYSVFLGGLADVGGGALHATSCHLDEDRSQREGDEGPKCQRRLKSDPFLPV
jgi:hypothetical protein